MPNGGTNCDLTDMTTERPKHVEEVFYMPPLPPSGTLTSPHSVWGTVRGLERLMMSATQQKQKHLWRLQQLHDVAEKAKAAHEKWQTRDAASQERQAKQLAIVQARSAARRFRESRAEEHRKAALTEADRRIQEERKAALCKWARAEEQGSQDRPSEGTSRCCSAPPGRC
eukprot:jgi/Botrbrau1/3285/Bobra.174_1s0050.1